jgi:Fe-S oxidoreductase
LFLFSSVGRIWIDILSPCLAENRVKEAAELGADILATGCLYCLMAFEDSIKTIELEGKIQTLDIAELLVLVI